MRRARPQITWCDANNSVWIPAILTCYTRHSELISTNGLLHVASDCDKIFYVAVPYVPSVSLTFVCVRQTLLQT